MLMYLLKLLINIILAFLYVSIVVILVRWIIKTFDAKTVARIQRQKEAFKKNKKHKKVKFE